MMNTHVMMMDDYYQTNKWVPFGAALAFHVFLIMWDPTILKAGSYNFPPQIINVKMMDHLPVIEPVAKPAPVPKPVEKKIEHKHVKKAKKSGLSMAAKAHPVPVSHQRIVAKPAAPKPFVSKIEMPKFVPHETDEPIAASPIPGVAPAAAHKAVNAFAPAPKLKGKSRGVRAQD